jgi:hypothetical protein
VRSPPPTRTAPNPAEVQAIEPGTRATVELVDSRQRLNTPSAGVRPTTAFPGRHRSRRETQRSTDEIITETPEHCRRNHVCDRGRRSGCPRGGRDNEHAQSDASPGAVLHGEPGFIAGDSQSRADRAARSARVVRAHGFDRQPPVRCVDVRPRPDGTVGPRRGPWPRFCARPVNEPRAAGDPGAADRSGRAGPLGKTHQAESHARA